MKTSQIHSDGRETIRSGKNFYQFGLTKTGAIVVFRPRQPKTVKEKISMYRKTLKHRLPYFGSIKTENITLNVFDAEFGYKAFLFTKKYDENGNCIGWE